MTSIPPAEPRPASVYSPDQTTSGAPPSFGYNASPTLVKVEGELFSSHSSQGIDDRPAKRRKLSVDNGSKSSAKTRLADDLTELSTVFRGKPAEENSQESGDLPPLPKRPWLNAPTRKGDEELKATHRARSPIAVPYIPDTMYTPDAAPQLSSKKHAAYFPWTGKHPEDALSEVNVKQGFYDRPPNPQERETNTARVPLYNALKHRSGLESLSNLFSLLLEAKSKHGLISSASTFKPPPRVTLAEAKRKSWIADLADANVPLRKLSRTIPQGIRGQGLLDQCIQNQVPLSRAIWFAKCVGANEIRTLKRKGTPAQAAVGTEGKWLREWTVNAEQFVETILAQVGQSAWKANVQYALRLATRLYLENLVDRDHYLDWIVKSFTESTEERLPFWLMVIHMYKQDITKFRKRGRQLAEALLQKYVSLKDWTQSMTQSLVEKLKNAIRGLALHRSHCFLLPDQWPSVKEALSSCLDTDVLKESQILRYLDRVNERTMGSNKHSYFAKPSDKDKTIGILDAAKAPYDPAMLSQTLMSACPDIHQLIVYCLEWATTRFRHGTARVYLTSRLLRRWQRQGFDVDVPITEFFTSSHCSAVDLDHVALRHIFSNLCRSQTFAVSKYLEWLNVRGLPHRDTIQSETVVTAAGGNIQRQSFVEETQVLLDLSTAKSSGHVTNLRDALLDRAGFDPEAQVDAIEKISAQLQTDLASLAQSTQLDISCRKSTKLILSNWAWNVRSKLSHWLRSFVAEAVKQQMAKRSDETLQPMPALSKGQFDFVRTALETLGDEAVLADVVGLCSSFADEQVQSSLVETIIRHADSFSAIGALESLQTRFCQIYMSLRNARLTMPLLATPLLELCTVFPTTYTSVRLLRQDLVRGDRGRAMAACSPFSDGIAESLQQAEETFIDDFEAVLQSEPSMHEHTMVRLFVLLTERIEKQQGTIIGEDALFSYCQLMARLRLCRPKQGDQLVKTWLTKALSKYAATFTRNLVYSLIGTGCLTIDILVEAISAIGRPTVVAHHQWLVSPDIASDHPCAYAVTTKWSFFGASKPLEALNLLGHAAKSNRSPYERQFCTSFMLGQSQDIERLTEASRKILDGFLRSLLDESKPHESVVGFALQSLDIFSVRFAKARLQMQISGKNKEESAMVAHALIDLVYAPDQDHESTKYIPHLLETMEDSIATEVRQIIEERALSILPKLSYGKGAEGSSLDMDCLARAKQAVDQAFELCPTSSSPSTKSSQKLVDVLLQMLKYLGSAGPSSTTPRTPTATSPTASALPLPQSISALQPSSPVDSVSRPVSSSIIEYLRIILQLLCLERPVVSLTSNGGPLPPPPKQSSDAVKVLAHLSLIITHPNIAVLPSTSDSSVSTVAREVIDFAYDVMATYVDDMTDDGRMLLSRILKDKIKNSPDERLKWLFGNVNTYGSDIPGGEELGKGLLVLKRDTDGGTKGKVLGEWKPKVWEVLETGGRGDADVAVGLGMFSARRV